MSLWLQIIVAIDVTLISLFLCGFLSVMTNRKR